MSAQKSTMARTTKIQWALFIVAMLSFLVGFVGINLQTISTYISETMFPKADHSVKSWTTPTILSSEFRKSLSVSPEYFVVMSVNMKTETPYLGEQMQFSISIENKGKNSVEHPRVEIYFVDYMDRVWAIWNRSITDDVLTEGFSFEYSFPSPDEKIVGDWHIFLLLYDDQEPALVSYVLREFTTTDVAPKPWWQDISILFVIVAIIFSILPWYEELYEFVKKRLKP